MPRKQKRTRSTEVGSSNRSEAFDFTYDDARVEEEARKLAAKFTNTSKEASSASDRCASLRCSTHESKTPSKGCTGKFEDVNVIVWGHQCTDCMSTFRSVASADRDNGEGRNIDVTAASQYTPNYENQPIYVIPDEGERTEMTLHSSNSPLANDEVSKHCLGAQGFDQPTNIMVGAKREGTGMSSSNCASSYADVEALLQTSNCGLKFGLAYNAVDVKPDLFIYEGMYCTEARLTFTGSCLKAEGSTSSPTGKTFAHEWAIDDIVNIESDWCLPVETAVVNLLLRSKEPRAAGSADKFSGVERLKFAVNDPDWPEVLDAIKLLNVKYRDRWNAVAEENPEQSHSGCVSEPCFSGLAEHSEDIIYPEGDPDAVSINKKDIELLWPRSFVNDTIIDFYIKFLETEVLAEERLRFHFFNSFFFRKLANLDKAPSRTPGAREAFQRVKKWTKNINIFAKDFIFVPVNYSLHWSLVVVCYLSEVAHLKDDKFVKSPKVPCILHLDSIRGSHRGLKNLFRSYLCEEWKYRHRELADDVPSGLIHIEYLSPELPQQENSFDCGLFLLHYAELFLKEATISINPLDIAASSKFLSRDWFSPAEASSKREHIRELLRRIVKDSFRKVPPADEHNTRESQKNEQDTDIQFVGETCKSAETCGVCRRSNVPIVCKTSSSKIYPPIIAQSNENAISTFRDLSDRGTAKQRSYERGLMAENQRDVTPPIKEVEEIYVRIVDSPPASEDSHELEGSATLFRRTSCSRKQLKRKEACQKHTEECTGSDSVSMTSTGESHSMSKTELDKAKLVLDLTDHEQTSKHKLEPPPTLVRFEPCIIEDSD